MKKEKQKQILNKPGNKGKKNKFHWKFMTKEKNFRKQKSTAMVLLDVKAAFDSVWHDGLAFKKINWQKIQNPIIFEVNNVCWLN